MASPTPFLPFFTSQEEACLLPFPSPARIGGIAAPTSFQSLLESGGHFGNATGVGKARKDLKEEAWVLDGRLQYDGWLRRVSYSIPVSDGAGATQPGETGPAQATHKATDEVLASAPGESTDSLLPVYAGVEEEQHFFTGRGSRKDQEAWFEVRQLMRGVKEGHKFVTVARWCITFDGFAASIRLLCGVHFRSQSEFETSICESRRGAYMLDFQNWCKLADRNARKSCIGSGSIARNNIALRIHGEYDGAGRDTAASETKVASDARASYDIPATSDTISLASTASHPQSGVSTPRSSTRELMPAAAFITDDVTLVLPTKVSEGEIILVEKDWDLAEKEVHSMSSGGAADFMDNGVVDDPGGLPERHWKRAVDRLSRWAAKSAQSSLGDEAESELSLTRNSSASDSLQARLLTLTMSQRNGVSSRTVVAADSLQSEEHSAEGLRGGGGVKEPQTQQTTRFTISIINPHLGMQFRDVHGIPVVASLAEHDYTAVESDSDEEDGSLLKWGEIAGAGGELVSRRNRTSFLELDTLFGGATTESPSSFRGELSASDLYGMDLATKCIIECPSIFGPGVKKLWRWNPTCDRDEVDSPTGMLHFLRGLLQRLGKSNLGADEIDLEALERVARISYFDREEEEYLSLDSESWPEFAFLPSKRLLIEVDKRSLGEKGDVAKEEDEPTSPLASEVGVIERGTEKSSPPTPPTLVFHEKDEKDDAAPSLAPASSSSESEADAPGTIPRSPCIGSILLAVSGVKTRGMSFRNVIDLLQTQQRPIELEFEDSWDRIFHPHLMETEAREKISRHTFDQKMNHPLASKLRKHISDWIAAFREQDLGSLCQQYDSNSKDPKAPHVMLWSLARWAEQQLRDLGVFSNNHKAGGGLPIMGELQWRDVKHHLERYIFEQVFDVCIAAAPDFGEGDAAIADRLACLRFLRPRHWCVESLSDSSSQESHGREWELVQRELCRLVEYQCPRDMIDCARACVKLCALSVEASLARRGQSTTFGADDLLAALSWVVVQANPPLLASRLWFMTYYLRTDDLESMGEGGYCLTQLASAVEFARECDSSVLADITEQDFVKGIQAHSRILALIDAATDGDEKLVQERLAGGADPNALSTDQQNTALTAAISQNRLSILSFLLEQCPETDPNVRICPNYGPFRYQTALMLAAQNGNLSATLLLLRHPKIDRLLVCSSGLTAQQYALRNGHYVIASLLEADPSRVSLVQAVAAGNIRYIRALLLQGCDPNSADSTGQLSALILATLLGNIDALRELLDSSPPPCAEARKPRALINASNVQGETPLMYCVQREGFATPKSQVEAAALLLKHGGDRRMRDLEGRTALDWAKHFGSVRLADVFEHDPGLYPVYEAARARNSRAVVALLTQGVDPNLIEQSGEGGYTALVASVFNQDLDMARILLADSRTDVNYPSGRGMTSLMYAAHAGHEPMVLLLLSRGADRYRRNFIGETALDIAKAQGRLDIVSILLHDPLRESICVAAANGHWSQVAALVKQGVSVNSRHRQRTFSGWHHEHYTPLIAACSRGHRRLAHWLIEQGASVDLPNMLGQTPLMYAISKGSEDLALLLLASSASRKATDINGRSVLWWAAHGERPSLVPVVQVDPAEVSIHQAIAAGSMDNVRALIRQGVSPSEKSLVNLLELFSSRFVSNVPNIASKSNLFRSSFEAAEAFLTPLCTAAIFGRLNIVRGLLNSDSFHVNIDSRDAYRRTALMYAARYGNFETVLLLLREGAHRYKHDRKHMTAVAHAIQVGEIQIAGIINADPGRVSLHTVCREGRLVLLEGLLKQGVDVNSQNGKKRYSSPLQTAAANKQTLAVAHLLRCPGINVDLPNGHGETALMHAARVGDLKICDLLLSAGARADLFDKSGMTAEHHSYAAGHVNMVLFKALCALRAQR